MGFLHQRIQDGYSQFRIFWSCIFIWPCPLLNRWNLFQVQAEVAAELPSAYLPREHWDTWDPMLISEGLFAGLATNSILFCWLHNQGLVQNKCVSYKRTIKACFRCDCFLGPPSLAQNTWWCTCFSVVLKAIYKANLGPLKGAVSAQKVLQVWDELMLGTEKESIFLMQGNLLFFPQKGNRKRLS